MSGFGKVMKEGWHPKSRQGGKESWRGDFKGINQVAGWMGKGKDKDTEREEHVSAPLSSLKDPSAFGPPPKHIKYHGAGAVPNQTTPDRSGLGAPLSQEQLYQQQLRQQQEEEAQLEAQRAQEEQARKPAPPPLPFRANRTGVDPRTLPPPPVRRVASPAESAGSSQSRPRPSVPPRMPSRSNTTPVSHPPSPPPAYSPHSEQPLEGELNQHATSSLSQAGVSVPALGIGNNNGTQGGYSRTASTNNGYASPASVNELQSRFSQMRTNSSSSPSQAQSPPVRATTYHQEPAELRPPSNHGATAAINDFREKHADKIDAGRQKLSGLGSRIGGFIDDRRSAPSTHSPVSASPVARPAPPIPPHPTQSTSSFDSEPVSRKKAPPPPPPKRAEMRSSPVGSSSPAPPPVPMNTKPR